MDQLQALNSYFVQIIDTIPARIYFVKNEEIIADMEERRLARIEESDLSAKSLQKRARLSGDSLPKVSEIAAKYYDDQKAGSKMSQLKKKLAKRIKELKGNRPEAIRDTRVGVKRPNNNNNNNNNNNKKLKNGDNNSVDSGNDSDDADTNNNDHDVDMTSTSITEPEAEGTLPQFVFSKFDFARQTDLAAEEKLAKNRAKKSSLKGQLANAEREERVLQELASRDPAAASRMKMEKMWNSALERAEGNKVANKDVKKLSKKVKQKDRQKVKSAKAWKDRKESIEHRKDKKQEKRSKNIQARKDQKKDKKIKIMKKRGRILD